MQDKYQISEGFLSRLCDLMSSSNIKTPTQLAAFADVGWSTAKQWLDGSIPRKHVLENLAEKFHVNPHWLLTGEGEKDPVTKEFEKNEPSLDNSDDISLESIEQQWRLTIAEYARDLPLDKLLDLSEVISKMKPYGHGMILTGLIALSKIKAKELLKKEAEKNDKAMVAIISNVDKKESGN
jgi:hypothetical protein